MDINKQKHMPFVEALEAYKAECFVPFHTPGHKLGREAPKSLKRWLGDTLAYDLGVMYALDDLHEPEGALREAQMLAADVYGAKQCWFSINGTTALIETMIMSVVGEHDTVIIPREAHKSINNALVLSGATPVYLEGRYSNRWNIPLGTTVEEVSMCLQAHPEAKAIVLVYPNYYGIGVDIEAIVEMAHAHGVIVLVDEAHGAHLPFSEALPVEAIAAGADLVAQSTHKLVGSLTQTSILLGQGQRIDYRRVTQVHQMLQSTSPNYIFLASLDMARHQLATEGSVLVERAVILANQLRRQLMAIAGIRVMDLTSLEGVTHFDLTKVLIDASELGLDGISFEKLLRKEHIEVELVQGNHVLVLITIGDTLASIQALVQGIQRISDSMINTIRTDNTIVPPTRTIHPLPKPVVAMTPRQAFYKGYKQISLQEAIGCISAETISYYPPGIPFLSRGEVITKEVVDYIESQRLARYIPNGAADITLSTIRVIDESNRAV